MNWKDIIKREYENSSITSIDNSVGHDLKDWITSIETGSNIFGGPTRKYPSLNDINSNRAEFDNYVNSMETLYKKLDELMETPFSEQLMEERRNKIEAHKQAGFAAKRKKGAEERAERLGPMWEKQIATEKRKREKAKQLNVKREPKHTNLLPVDDEE
tara:strand:- start:243 stop:716 length:474 start_codon:yes stop_codon:yes gene_type:complete